MTSPHAAGELIVRKCAKYGHIRVYKLRHVESAYHIFVGIKVYTVFPPIPESTWDNSVVGIWTNSTPRR